MYSRSIVVVALLALVSLLKLADEAFANAPFSDEDIAHLDGSDPEFRVSIALKAVGWALGEDLKFTSIDDAVDFVHYSHRLARYAKAPEQVSTNAASLVPAISSLLEDPRVQLANGLATSEVSRFSVLDSNSYRNKHALNRYSNDGPYSRFASLKRRMDMKPALASVLGHFYELKREVMSEDLLESAAKHVHQNMLLKESNKASAKGCSLKTLEPICQLVREEDRQEYLGIADLAEAADMPTEELEGYCKQNNIEHAKIRQTCMNLGSLMVPVGLVREYELLGIFEADQLESKIDDDPELSFYYALEHLCESHFS